jgi:putative ABC transport system substrate-binding protein
MKRREFIAGLGGAVVAWPVVARAQQGRLPVVAFVSVRSAIEAERDAAAFRKGLHGVGIVEGQNATLEYNWLDGEYGRLPSLLADLVRRRVAVIAIPASAPAALAAKAATSTIPIVFGVGDDPVKLGLVANLARPGGNATGSNFLLAELTAKQLGLLHELVPKADRVGVLVNPANPTNAETTLRGMPEATRALGLQVQVANASTVLEIDRAFATLAREHAGAVLISPDAFFTSRRVQLSTLAARHGIPTMAPVRDFVEAGLLMSYGTDIAETYRQVGEYVGRILNGTKPEELPVQQSTKIELVINESTARALGLTVPPDLLAIADQVIE